jgi:hypothetical protein
MSAWIIPPIVGLIEPCLAPEFFIDSIGGIERVGDSIRIYYCAEQLPLETVGGITQQIVAVKIRRPLSSVPQAIVRLARCLDCDFAPRAGAPDWQPRLVR